MPESGKSNIIRAIHWLLTNRPLGFRFNSDLTSDGVTNVQAGFEDGSYFGLNKSKKEATYYIGNDTVGDADVFKAIGSDVPDVISQIANMTELNSQEQTDQPFLICNSAGEVAKTFNRITKLEKVDSAISAITTDINSENKKIKQLELQEVELKKKLDGVGDVDSMVDELAKIKLVAENLDDTKLKINCISDLVYSVEKSDGILKQQGTDLNADELKITEMESLVFELEQAEKTYDDVQGLINDVENMETRMESQRKQSLVKTKEFKEYLLSNEDAGCPFCENCTVPFSEHHLDKFLKEYKI